MMEPDIETILSPMDYVPDRTLIGRINRKRTFWKKVAPIAAPPQSIITFGFDDFPKSAVDTGADIIESVGARAIFYACSGLAGRTNATGEQYDDTDMLALSRAGHEIGAHTHTHLDCAHIPTAQALNDIERNLTELKSMGLDTPLDHFAYPYGETTIVLKTSLKTKFATARGIHPGNNGAGTDRMQLAALELTPDDATTARAIAAIEHAATVPGWLHIFTHDVRPNPSPFGTTPQALRRIVHSARDSGIQIKTPSAALKSVGNYLNA